MTEARDDPQNGTGQSIRSFRDLTVWQESIRLAEICYRLTALFPERERYGLTGQIRRAVRSIPNNIAEGSNRRTTAALLNYLSIALGSEGEVQSCLELSVRLGFTDRRSVAEALAVASGVGRQLRSLMKSLERSTRKR